MLPYKKISIFAPELFGYGNAYGIQTKNREFFIVHSYWQENDWQENHNFIFIVSGKRDGEFLSGSIIQLYGMHIPSYPPYNCSSKTVYCYERQDKPIWRGWIDFRGHARPLCGGEKINYPCAIFVRKN
jgi:hypothetical protein